MGTQKYYGIEVHNLEEYKKDREECIADKGGAIMTHFDELDGIVNITKFSNRFLGKSHSWFSQRLHGAEVMKKQQSFKTDEYASIAEGFRELARQLSQYADELDKAE